MIAKSFINLATALLAGASPITDASSCSAGRPKPSLPSTGGDTELQAPSGNLTLKHIALGFGIQNYTCAGVDATPKATGALAVLYDITDLYPGQTYRSLPSVAAFQQLGVTAMYGCDVPLNLDSSALTGSAGIIHQGADAAAPFPADAPLEIDADAAAAALPSSLSSAAFSGSIPFLGHHFFDASSVPNFVLSDLDYVGSKDQEVPAPKTADKGVDGTGAVSWLRLGPKDGTYGAKELYRVTTVGGASHGCSEEGRDSTTYTAQYWFFE
ncbi:Protein of unknown function (DUF3455) [Geosmithia morbida]|uniref:Malate dehydrogenase n=1 Tax=Geosmithia morbida TaxID=1094350 RepID=A0A9P4YQ59_9HYPO|nr:Protein of unknown function (DUF3455) [Geosmithia morbida]KAF4119995.1 Protein of unknown function (DUF3455) [Geosmithia morbida]